MSADEAEHLARDVEHRAGKRECGADAGDRPQRDDCMSAPRRQRDGLRQCIDHTQREAAIVDVLGAMIGHLRRECGLEPIVVDANVGCHRVLMSRRVPTRRAAS